MSLGKLIIKIRRPKRFTLSNCKLLNTGTDNLSCWVVYKVTGELLFRVEKSIDKTALRNLLAIYSSGHTHGEKDARERTFLSTERKRYDK